MYIQPKSGRLATGAYAPDSPIRGEVFRYNSETQTSDLPMGDGGLYMPNDRTLTVYANPNVRQYSIATIRKKPALVSYYNTTEYTPATKPLVQPSVRTVLNAKGKARPVIKNTFVSPTSNTPFHPKQEKKAPQPRFKSEANTEKQLHHVSFPSFGNNWGDANNSFVAGSNQVATGKLGHGRWNTVKKSAV